MDDEVNEKINYSLCCLSKSYEGWGAHKRTRLSGLLEFSDLSNEMRKELLEDSLFDLESIILFRMIILCMLYIVKIMVDIGKLLTDVSILSILIQQQ